MLEGLKKLFGDGNARKLKKFYPIIEQINAFEPALNALSDQDLKAKTDEFKKRLSQGENLDNILPEAFAVVREASRRNLGERHFDVQLLGGMVLNGGAIAEMRTGEGKTLVATLPAYLNALSGKGVQIVTVNDYLSRRDAVWMGQIYNALGLSVGVINHESSFLYDPELATNNQQPTPNTPSQGSGSSGQATNNQTQEKEKQNKNGEEKGKELDKERDELGSFKIVHEFLKPCTRREAYHADITYGTNNEFGFDYLRDNLAYEEPDLRQRDYNYAIVDEIDSILIDEARTPLIISAPSADSEDLYQTFAGIAEKLVKESDYTVDEKMKAISLTSEGISRAEKMLGVENIYTEKGIKYVHHLETAVRAKALFEKDKDYVVKDGQVIIVDEFTGRLQPGRRWSEGLHQAIEAKENVPVQKESRTMASITFQNYFRFYKKLSGMTGTAVTSSEEFYKVYGLDVISIPTNKPTMRKDHNDLIFQTETGKFKAVAEKVKELNKTGQPVLIGTVSIEKNELLSAYLKTEGVPHEVLNAKNHEREGEIIAQAGRKGAVTIATNMAGRGVDIKLGGNPASPEEAKAVKEVGGLFVLGTERHEARRIDNQLRGRSGRQGDPGSTQFFVSLEDSLMRIFASDTVKKMMGRFGIPEDQPIENYIINKSLESAQEKIEGFNFDNRKHILEYDDVLNHQRKIIYETRRKILLGNDEDVDARFLEIAGNILVEGDSIEKTLQMLEQKKKALGDKNYYQVSKRVILQTVDMFWVEHLEVMDYMRGSVNLRAYGQRDPLVEYKREGLHLFKEMQMAIDAQILKIMGNIEGIIPREEKVKMEEVHAGAKLLGSENSGSKITPQSKIGLSSEAHRAKLGRNDPCYCGSGKKYKKCHGA
ncbi:MAG: preprotein translocase subunit SecA [Candidatus Paceibacterota bacterium]